MDKFIAYIAGEGRVVLQAPVIFLTVLALLGGAVFAAVSYAYSARFEGQASSITSLEGRLKLKDEQLQDYRSKLDGASPDEAKKRMDVLEAKIATLLPRRLSEEQKLKIKQAIEGIRAQIDISQDIAAADAKAFSMDFAHIFANAGWVVQTPGVMGLGSPPTSGIALRVQNPASLSQAERSVKAGLDNAGIRYDIQPGRSPPPVQFRGPDVELVFTTKIE